MKKDITKPITVTEVIISIILSLYALVLYAFSVSGNEFFYSGITVLERIIFWCAAAAGIASFFIAVNSELNYGKNKLYKFFSMVVVCAGLLPLTANAYDSCAGSEIIQRVALGITASGLVLSCISRRSTTVALVCYAMTAAGAFLPGNKYILGVWAAVLFVLPVAAAALSLETKSKLTWLRLLLCCVCGAACVTGFVFSRAFYSAAAPCCMLYTALTIWLNGLALKRLRNEKKQKKNDAAAASEEKKTQTESDAAADAPAAPENETGADSSPAPVAAAPSPAFSAAVREETSAIFSARQIRKSITQELAMSERFDGVLAFLLDTNGSWFRYSRTRKDIFPCDDVYIPPLGSLLEKGTEEAVINTISSRESCEIGCRLWDNRICEYSDAIIKSAALPDGRKYVLAVDISSVVKHDKDLISSYEKQIKELNEELSSKEKNESRIFHAMIEAFISLIEERSEESARHINNIALITSVLMKKAQELFPEKNITDGFIRDVTDASIFNDIGKIKVPDAVLEKDGKYTAEEFEQMKLHTIYGGEIINRLPYTSSQEHMLKYAYEIAVKHHERIDGNGYPYGLKGDDIPFYVQIVSLADVFEALTSKRVYKDEIPFDEAVENIRSGACGVFSDDVMKCLNESENDLRNTHLT